MRDTRTDVVVIGGGVIGTSVAYHLARGNVNVTLLDRGDLASGTSGACDGLVFMQSKKPGVHLELALASRGLFQRLNEELPFPIEYKSSGGLVIIETEAELEAMGRFVEEQRKIGLDVSLLDAKQTRGIEPELSRDIKGATYSPLDGQVNPIALTLGFASGAGKLGANLITGAFVESIELSGNRVIAVESSKGRFLTDVVVNAAGVYAPEIGKTIGLHIPITPRRGQIIVTQACKPLLDRCLISAKYIVAKYNPQLAEGKGEGISIEQSENGNFLLGSTREFVGFDRRTTTEAMKKITRQTSRIIPRLKDLDIIRTFAGLRPYTPDGLPILGPVKGIQGFIMAAGHEGDGIALSPITGRLIAQWITDGRTDIPIEAFRLERFEG